MSDRDVKALGGGPPHYLSLALTIIPTRASSGPETKHLRCFRCFSFLYSRFHQPPFRVIQSIDGFARRPNVQTQAENDMFQFVLKFAVHLTGSTVF